MSVSNVAAPSGEVQPSSTAEAMARMAAAGLKSCARCLTMCPPDAEGCTFCGQRFGLAITRQAATMALRATVIPMLVGAVGVCIWLLVQGQAPALLLGPH